MALWGAYRRKPIQINRRHYALGSIATLALIIWNISLLISLRAIETTDDCISPSGFQLYGLPSPCGKRICLATLEFKHVATGGIGTAMAETAETLAAAGHHVTVLLLNDVNDKFGDAQRDYASRNITLLTVKPPNAPNDGFEAPYGVTSDSWQLLQSFRFYNWLKHCQAQFDVVVFHEWFGIGFHVVNAKHLGTDFQGIETVAVLHGSHLWALNNQRNAPKSINDVVIDYLERSSVGRSDYVMSPSLYIANDARALGWSVPELGSGRLIVLPNPISDIRTHEDRVTRRQTKRPVNEVVFFGKTNRHKGIDIFCDAVDVLAQRLRTLDNLKITFLARLLPIDNIPALEWLEPRIAKWRQAGANVQIIADRTPEECRQYLRDPSSSRLAVMPSVSENSPYVVIECLEFGVPFLTSDVGGTGELVHENDAADVLVEPKATAFASGIERAIRHGSTIARPRLPMADVNRKYASWFAQRRANRDKPRITGSGFEAMYPRQDCTDRTLKRVSSVEISIIITTSDTADHTHLVESFKSAMAQRCRRVEVIIVSPSDGLLSRLQSSGVDVASLRIVRDRSRAAASARGRYLLFMRDDTLLFPWSSSDLLHIALRTGAIAVTTSPLYCRADLMSNLATDFAPVNTSIYDYHLIAGGPVTAGLFVNTFGGNTFMIGRREFAVLKKGERQRPTLPEGYEEWEMYAKLHLAGLHVEHSIEPVSVTQHSSVDKSSANVYHGTLEATRPFFEHLQHGSTQMSIDWSTLQRLFLGITTFVKQ